MQCDIYKTQCIICITQCVIYKTQCVIKFFAPSMDFWSSGGFIWECRSILWGVQELQEFRRMHGGLNLGVQEDSLGSSEVQEFGSSDESMEG